MRASLVKNAKKQLKNVKQIYKDHIKNGWTLNDLDEMDIHFYFSLYNEESEKVYIDEVQLL